MDLIDSVTGLKKNIYEFDFSCLADWYMENLSIPND